MNVGKKKKKNNNAEILRKIKNGKESNFLKNFSVPFLPSPTFYPMTLF